MLTDLTSGRKRALCAYALLGDVLAVSNAPRLPPEAERALAELDRDLAEHGRPCPERTAAWLEHEARPAGDVLAVVPRG